MGVLAVQELLLTYCWTPCCDTVITRCAYVVCYFRDVYPFIYFIIAVYVHHLGLYCVLFHRFLISKINVALQLTKLLLKKVTTTTTSVTSRSYIEMAERISWILASEHDPPIIATCRQLSSLNKS